VLRGILARNRGCAYLRPFTLPAGKPEECIRALPCSEYADYRSLIGNIASGRTGVLTREPVLLLQPTSGSESASKLIPYTRSLQQQFRLAIDAWTADLFLCHPNLLAGRHYWSISPVTRAAAGGAVPVGYQEDAEYLGFVQRQLSRLLFVVPPAVRLAGDPEAFAYLTLLFLVRERNLRFVSIWSPSFLLVLLDRLPGLFERIVQDIERGALACAPRLSPEVSAQLEGLLKKSLRRSRELRALDIRSAGVVRRIWPRLSVISCWTDAAAADGARELQRRIPGVKIQSKGLIATEGVVTIPVGREGRKALAAGSHFFEFRNPQTGRLHNAWELRQGSTYAVLLTTGGGLYRYQLHDLVKVTGFFGRVPCLDFVAREGVVSDLVGEKVHQAHVAQVLAQMARRFPPGFAFRLLCPCREHGRQFYCLFYELRPPASARPGAMSAWLEGRLSENYHYRHARQMGQLEALRLFEVAESTGHEAYLERLVARGLKRGDVKPADLRRETDWHRVFDGRFTA
jgi:hypothetical protein